MRAGQRQAEYLGLEFESMLFLHHADARFLHGLNLHGFPAEHGLRLLNTGFITTPFGQRWSGSPLLASARTSERPYYIDRITGGMPFQSLEGIEQIAKALKGDSRFLGFQVHEWDNSPFHDHRRIRELLVNQGKPFDEEHFAHYAGRTDPPYFSGGNYAIYRDLFQPLESMQDVRSYLETYFSQLVAMTAGQVMSVNGHGQFPHAALRLGAKNVMAEVGNQVSLTALQVACTRGAARQYGKPFGIYYETWGGSPFGCTCATDFSPWFATCEQFKAFHDMGEVGPRCGSSRSLQRRLLFFAWLSGAAWWSEEWGAENYFANWDDCPLTEYGWIVKQFADATAGLGPVTPIVPAAVILPPDAFGVDIACIAGSREKPFRFAQPDACHIGLRSIAPLLLAPQPIRPGEDAHNLTPSPWSGCFDVLSAEVPPSLLSHYAVAICFDAAQARQAARHHPHVCLGAQEEFQGCLPAIRDRLPFRVEGEVGCVQASTPDRLLIGLFNNLGITKTGEQEVGTPEFSRLVTVEGSCSSLAAIWGSEHIRRTGSGSVTLELPPGEVTVLSFPR